MRHLLIRSFGPIKEASLELGQVNVIIGLQSSGKSCILKTACFCSWVEKRLEITQKINEFGEGSAFIDLLTSYYKMSGYVHNDTYIEYETDYMKFSYSHSCNSFKMQWKSEQWEYHRPKISYVPADRNLVAAIPGWSSLQLDDNMIAFMSDWDKARKFIKKKENFLNLGMTYSYDSTSNTDNIRLENGDPLMLKESSSGIQSLLPLYIHLDYLASGQYDNHDTKTSYDQIVERRNLLSTIYGKLYDKDLQTASSETVTLEGSDYYFPTQDEAKHFKELHQRYTMVDHSEIFLEEPEDNLFPPTQCQLVNWMLEISSVHNDMLFIATHSPYILNQFIKQDPKGLTIFFTHQAEEGNRIYSVRTLEKEEIREIYDNGVDMFLNFELYL